MNAFPFTNSLIRETSPYLLQHAHNPVNWYGWHNEALQKAKDENKPILLSIGYSACHWCHVMEKESFENEAIAAVMNRHFVNIKVDREERPDLDQLYQNAVQFFIKRGGGWPLTMFLTPDRIPFYGGTYFPPEDRYQIPGFARVLEAAARAYRENEEEIARNGSRLLEGLAKLTDTEPVTGQLSPRVLDEAVTRLAAHYHATWGGFGSAPKFPNAGLLEIFFRHFYRTGDEDFRNKALHTLRCMGKGGLYDQLGGGFHRYSVDEKWLVPHFEKMLYDNAQLVPLYLNAYQISKETFFREIAVETLDYVLREMTSPEGGFYSTQDADSDGIEGNFFVWDLQEVQDILGQDKSRIFCRYFDITLQGNFDGRNILNRPLALSRVAEEFGIPEIEAAGIIASAKRKLFEKRETRSHPFRDEKILTAWNALMISSLIRGFRVTGSTAYLRAAEKSLSFLVTRLYSDGNLFATFQQSAGKLKGYLDDYAFLIAALLDFWELRPTGENLDLPVRLTEQLLAEFWDKERGGFFFTGTEHEPLIQRPKSGHDHSVPSGNAVSARNLLRLYQVTGITRYLDFAESLFRNYYAPMFENPFAFGAFISSFDTYLNGNQIILIGRNRESLNDWSGQISRDYLPQSLLIAATSEEAGRSGIPLLQDKPLIGGSEVSAYFCRQFTCFPPVTSLPELEKLLQTERHREKGNSNA
jgi:hypothetical protein